MTASGDIAGLPMWLKLVLLFAGIILMLTGADLVPADATRFHTPHWVVFVAGVAFCSVGVVTFLAQHRNAHPARYLFAVGILMTCLFVVSTATSIYASGTAISIGPVFIKGAVADKISRYVYGFGALVVGALVLAVWISWYRTIKSPNLALQSGRAAHDRSVELER
jgi:hypothetical protein